MPVLRSKPDRHLLAKATAGALLAGLVLAGAATAQVAPVLVRTETEPGQVAPFVPLPTPTLNFYGSPGLMDMPTGEMMPDGQVTVGVGYFGGQGRYTLGFQAFPWLSATFRYSGIGNLNLFGYSTYYDRSFDVRIRLHKETRRWPEITLGLQDLIGTGIYAGEYIVATKNFATPGWGAARLPGKLKVSAGLGWGRFGTSGTLGTSGSRPAFDGGTGGQVAFDQWFRGPFAAFGGIEWQPTERLGLKLEYSSDAYVTETQVSSVFQRKSQFNFGAEYQVSPRTRLGAYYMYGSEIGVTAQFQLNPRFPTRMMTVPAPQIIQPRPDRASAPQAWDTSWAASETVPLQLRDKLAPVMRAQGLLLESLTLEATSAEVRFRNLQYMSYANAVGRAARAMAQVLPASVETFRMVPLATGMAMSAVTIRRSDLEALEFDPESAEALLAVSGITDAPALSRTALPAADVYPDKGWTFEPYFQPGYFDPDKPFRLDVGVAASGFYSPAPGWLMAGTIRQRLAGNIKDGRLSNSVLPHVRTDGTLYAQADTTLLNLYVLRQWRPREDVYARVTAGYFEPMYGGISGELLWKPVASRLGLGLELNYVAKRDFDQRLGFQDYKILTGHASAYYQFGEGWLGQVDVGRYLAGDVGATISLDREFANGWRVGGFFTLTNVSAADFGEGSFDKGIRFSIPLGWFLGLPSRQAFGTTIRPIQRDGGARVFVPGRLYQQVRQAHRYALEEQWVRTWE